MSLQAMVIDSTFADPLLTIIWAYQNQNKYGEARKWYQKAYEKKNLLTRAGQIDLQVLNAYLFGTYYDVIRCLRQQKDFDDQKPMVYYDLGSTYISLFQYDKAIPELKKALEIYNKWGVKPFWSGNYMRLGEAYHKTGQYREEKKLYKKAEKDFPDDYILISREAILSLTEGDTVTANQYIENYKSLRKERSSSEAAITTSLARIYSEAGILDKAEKYYQQALLLEPEDTVRMYNLAYFLIDKDRNINKGLVLIEKALQLSPDNYSYLHCKGWGLYKQGKYQEAIEILQKSWDLRRKLAYYDHVAYLHLEAAKKAVANQK
jgi:tetratricopeptide (TPR) repeat protein